jgi:hypothetical protein
VHTYALEKQHGYRAYFWTKDHLCRPCPAHHRICPVHPFKFRFTLSNGKPAKFRTNSPPMSKCFSDRHSCPDNCDNVSNMHMSMSRSTVWDCMQMENSICCYRATCSTQQAKVTHVLHTLFQKELIVGDGECRGQTVTSEIEQVSSHWCNHTRSQKANLTKRTRTGVTLQEAQEAQRQNWCNNLRALCIVGLWRQSGDKRVCRQHRQSITPYA